MRFACTAVPSQTTCSPCQRLVKFCTAVAGQGAASADVDLHAAVLQHLGLQAAFKVGSHDLPQGLAALTLAHVNNGCKMTARTLAASHHTACTISNLERLLQVGHMRTF